MNIAIKTLLTERLRNSLVGIVLSKASAVLLEQKINDVIIGVQTIFPSESSSVLRQITFSILRQDSQFVDVIRAIEEPIATSPNPVQANAALQHFGLFSTAANEASSHTAPSFSTTREF